MNFLERLRETNTARYIAWTGTEEVDVLFAGIDLEAATTNKFNKTSEANDFPHRF